MLKRLLGPTILVSVFFLFATLALATDPPAVTCTYDGNPSRPGGNCALTVPYVNSNINDYSKSAKAFNLACPVNPEVFPDVSSCESPPILYNSQGVTVSTNQSDEDGLLPITYLTDFSKLTLGGLGPDTLTYQGAPPDNLARVYPYSGLADKPIDLNSTLPREAFRTFWRLSTLRQQLEVRAAFFKRFTDQTPPIFNSALPYATPSAAIGGTPENYPPLPPYPSSQGPNIGYAHLDPFFGQAAAGKPATFLVSLGTNLTTLQGFSTLYSSATIRIIRILDLAPSTSALQLTVFAAQLSLVFTNPSDIVVFGNELNDPGEYPCGDDLSACGRTYAAQFAAFKIGLGGLKVAAAPLNTGHGFRDALPFLTAAASAYQAADYTAHNVYDRIPACPAGYDPIRCTTSSWQWERTVTGNTGKPYIFTEYNLAPGQDTDLMEVIKFITTPVSGPTAATSLIRNTCASATGAWLIYDGKVLADSTGKAIDPTSCQTTYPSFRIKDLVDALPDCLKTYPLPQTCGLFKALGITVGAGLVGDTPQDAYRTLEKSDPDLKAKYDAFQPFDFDNLRNYLALYYQDVPPEKASENYFGKEYNTDNRHVGVLAENVPYIQALNDILNNSLSFGILSAVSPQFVNDLRQKELSPDEYFQNLTYPAGVTNPQAPENLAALKAQLLAKESAEPVTSTAGDNEKIYRVIGQDAIQIWQRDLASGVAGCFKFDPKGPTLPAPSTSPDKLPHQEAAAVRPGAVQAHWEPTVSEPNVSSINQMVFVPVHTTGQFPQPTTNNDGSINCNNGCSADINGFCPTHYFTHYNAGGFTHHPLSYTASPWVIDNVGRAIAVFNNPKLTDFSNMISNGVNSLYKMLLPSNLLVEKTTFKSIKKGENTLPMLADQAAYSSKDSDTKIDVDGNRGGGGSPTAVAQVSREGGQAEVDLCKLRNFWLRPSQIQAGIPSDCEDLKKYLSYTSPTASTSAIPNICTLANSGIKSQALLDLIAQAGAWAHVPTDVLTIVLRSEAGCIGSPTDQSRLCNVDDATVNRYSEEGQQFPVNCSVGGPFTFLSGEWPKWKEAVNKATGSNRVTNACNIKDSIYAAAWELSAGALACPQLNYDVSNTPVTWSQEMKENSVSHWAYGCTASRCNDPLGFSQYYCAALSGSCTNTTSSTSNGGSQ